MSGKRALLVLDDAINSDHVLPLLPAAAGTLVLVTSRRRLTALPEATSIALDILEPSEAASYLYGLLAAKAFRPLNPELSISSGCADTCPSLSG